MPSSLPEKNHKDVYVQTNLTGIELTKTLDQLRRDKKCLQKQLARRNCRVSNLKGLIQLLKDNSQLTEGVQEYLTSSGLSDTLPFELFENEIENADRSATNKRYSDKIKEFCLTLHFYSPKAYEFLRKRSTLPHESTIRKWIATRECNPGVLHEVVQYLKTESSKKVYLQDVALIYDCMSIRSGRWYSKKDDKFYGYCDLGGTVNLDVEEYATEVLLFEIVSLTCKFKVPVAYFLVNKIDASLQKELALAVITALYDANVIVRSLTSDGSAHNLSTYRKLGCLFYDLENLKPYFPHPCDPESMIVCLIDPAHAIKLCRNCMAEKDLSSPAGNISFNYIKRIHQIQEKENLKLANKLTSCHVFYKKKKMNVSSAAQTVSSRVADTLQFLKNTDEEFVNAGATIEFLRIFDRLFDVMNARSVFSGGYKSPMTWKNRYIWQSVFKDAREYILKLECDNISIFKHRRKTFAFAFLMNTISYELLAMYLLQRKKHPFKYFLPYKTSQDHVELTFSCIRSRSGHNDNPHALQLKWILRRMLYRNSVTASKNANCKDEDECSVGIFPLNTKLDDHIPQSDHNGVFPLNTKLDDHIPESDHMPESQQKDKIESMFSEEIAQLLLFDDVHLSDLQNNVLYFIAGSIAKQFIEKFPCEFCEECILVEPNADNRDHTYSSMSNFTLSDYTSLTGMKNNGGLLFISKVIFDIVTYSEKVYSLTVVAGILRKENLKRDMLRNIRKYFITTGALRNLNHPIISTADDDQHELKILNFFASQYLLLRIYTQCKKETLANLGHKSTMRQHLHHLTLFSNT